MYLTEFPDFDYALPTLRGFHDDSWHNDTCPSLACTLTYHTIHGDVDGARVKIWVDYADPARRETHIGAARYTVTVSLDDETPQTIAASDDWQTVIDTLRALRWLA